MKKTIAQQLNVTDFPFEIWDENGNLIYMEWDNSYWERWERNDKGDTIYFEDSNSFWARLEYGEQGNTIYYETSNGLIKDNRPKPQAEPMTIEIDGKKYKLIEI